MLEQHGTHLTDVSFIKGMSNTLAQVKYLLAALLFLLGTHLVGNLQSLGAGTLAIREYMVLGHG